MMPSPLSQLVEVALGTQGCVNFNSLRTLLVAIVRQLEEGSQSQLDRDRTSVSAPCIPASSSATGLRQHRRSGPQRGGRVSPQSASEDDGVVENGRCAERDPCSTTDQSGLESRVNELERALVVLQSELSTQEQAGIRAGQSAGQTDGQSRARKYSLDDQWYYIQLKKRVDTNEQGVDAVVKMLADATKETEQLKQEQQAFNEVVSAISQRVESLEKRQGDLEQNLEVLHKDMDHRWDSVQSINSDLDSLRRDVDNLTQKCSSNGSDDIKRLELLLQQSESALGEMHSAMQEIAKESASKSNQIKELAGLCQDLQMKKADKEDINAKLSLKADLDQLQTRLDQALFSTFEEDTRRAIEDLLDQLETSSAEWKSEVGKMTVSMDSKLDKKDLSDVVAWLQQTLAVADEKIKVVDDLLQDIFGDQAAAVKRPYIQTWQCLSCDRTVNLVSTGSRYKMDLKSPPRHCGGKHTSSIQCKPNSSRHSSTTDLRITRTRKSSG